MLLIDYGKKQGYNCTHTVFRLTSDITYEFYLKNVTYKKEAAAWSSSQNDCNARIEFDLKNEHGLVEHYAITYQANLRTKRWNALGEGAYPLGDIITEKFGSYYIESFHKSMAQLFFARWDTYKEDRCEECGRNVLTREDSTICGKCFDGKAQVDHG